MYTPNPIDTSHVVLGSDITKLTEIIAKNTHEVWAATRIAEGWTYGEKRDDEKKTTPCLVPYEELPEIEKNYDRITAMGALKLIVAMGYKITKKDL